MAGPRAPRILRSGVLRALSLRVVCLNPEVGPLLNLNDAGVIIFDQERFLHSVPSEAMPHRVCPICEQPGRLVALGKESVEYYLCEPCEHVWSESRLTPDAPPVSVTPRPAVPREKQTIHTRALTTPRARPGRIH